MDDKIQDEWMLAEAFPDIDFYFTQIWLSSFVNDLEKTIGINYDKIVCVYKGYDIAFYYGKDDSFKVGKRILDMIIANPSFGRKINSKIRLLSKKLKVFSGKISPENMSGAQLAKLFLELDRLHTELYTWGWLPNAVDMFHNNYTDYLKKMLAGKLPEDKVNHALMVLAVSPHKSILQQEQESLLHVAALKQAGKRYAKELEAHCRKYFHLKHLWIGKDGIYDLAYYEDEIKRIISEFDAEEALKKEGKTLADNLAERKRLIKQLKLSKKDAELFDIYADFAVTKLYRRDAQIFWAYKMGSFFREVARRLKLSDIEARFMLPEEAVGAIKNGVRESLRSELKQRAKLSVYFAVKGKDSIFIGRKAEEFEKSLETEHDQDLKELHGQPACIGYAKGRVKIVNTVADMAKMKKGDILVSFATNPDIVPAMKKAAAIVTEQGGITSHAAIVSREWGTPCIIGTKIATKVLKDGDLVEVDANKGIVRKI
jgi:phosphohistidine swiveling domain-containing protein